MRSRNVLLRTCLPSLLLCLSPLERARCDEKNTSTIMNKDLLQSLIDKVQSTAVDFEGQPLPEMLIAVRKYLSIYQPGLVATVRQADQGNAIRASYLLSFLPLEPSVVSSLKEMAARQASEQRRAALQALQGIGANDFESRQIAVRYLGETNDPGLFVVAAACVGAWKVQGAIPSLVSALNTSDLQVSSAAARALGDIGHSASSALTRLEQLRDELSKAKADIDEAITKISGP